MEEPLLGLQQTNAKRSQRRTGLIVLVVAVLAGGGLFWRFGPAGNSSRDLTPFTVEATRGSLSGVVTASGELKAVRRVNVSPRNRGLLDQLLVDEGDEVAANQVLAVMDRGDILDRLDERRALLRQAEANFRAKQDDFKRRESLFRDGVLSADDFNTIRNDMVAAEAQVIAARERIEQLEEENRQLLIRAPFPGTITARYADPGAFVTPTTTASTNAGATSSSVVELSQGLEAVARVPESDIGRIVIGQDADVRVDAFPDERFKARVSEIAPRAQKQDNVTSFEVELELIDPPAKLLIGMTADVDFKTGRSPARTLVPTVAIVTENGTPGVLLVADDQQPRFQKVDLGSSSGDQTAILKGLQPGTRVFIDLPPWAKQERD
jgi:HlyD family secretion protein